MLSAFLLALIIQGTAAPPTRAVYEGVIHDRGKTIGTAILLEISGAAPDGARGALAQSLIAVLGSYYDLLVDAETDTLTRLANRRIFYSQVGALLARGDRLLSIGDVTSARLFYERAADGGAGLAALRLGETYDPVFLDRVHLRGVRADLGAASSWYRRARDLGTADAEVLLRGLETK